MQRPSLVTMAKASEKHGDLRQQRLQAHRVLKDFEEIPQVLTTEAYNLLLWTREIFLVCKCIQRILTVLL